MKRATSHESPEGRTWHCYHDQEVLAFEDEAAVTLHRELVHLGRSVGGLPTFGLSSRSRTRGRSLRGGVRTEELPGLPVYVYCPRPGCGRGQQIG
jgi:hypothetical protein